MLGYILARRKVWGLTLGFACYGYSNSLFASWLPTYFVQTMNVSLLKSASFTMLPWFIATGAQFVIAGWLVDRLVQRGHDETLVRKSTIIACLLGGLAILGAAFTREVFWVLFWMTISVSALTSASSIGWSFPSLVAPRGGSGIVGAVMNTMNAAVGSISAIVTGAIVDATGSFAVAFVVAAAVLLAGVGFYGLLMGRIEPVPDLPARGAARPRSSGRITNNERETKMKIARIETFLLHPGSGKNLLFCRVETDDGLHGWGEAYVTRGKEKVIEECLRCMAPYVIGRSSFNIRHTGQVLFDDFAIRRNSMELLSAWSAIEIALWDILGKRTGVPVYNLLGGRSRAEVRVYANGWSHASSVEENIERALALKQEGFTAAKFDPFPGPWRTHVDPQDEDYAVDFVSRMRDALGPEFELLIEAHRASRRRTRSASAGASPSLVSPGTKNLVCPTISSWCAKCAAPYRSRSLPAKRCIRRSNSFTPWNVVQPMCSIPTSVRSAGSARCWISRRWRSRRRS